MDGSPSIGQKFQFEDFLTKIISQNCIKSIIISAKMIDKKITYIWFDNKNDYIEYNEYC